MFTLLVSRLSVYLPLWITELCTFTYLNFNSNYSWWHSLGPQNSDHLTIGSPITRMIWLPGYYLGVIKSFITKLPWKFTFQYKNAIVLKCKKLHWKYPTVKNAMWCNSCISFAQMRKLLDFSQRAQRIIQALQLYLVYSLAIRHCSDYRNPS